MAHFAEKVQEKEVLQRVNPQSLVQNIAGYPSCAQRKIIVFLALSHTTVL